MEENMITPLDRIGLATAAKEGLVKINGIFTPSRAIPGSPLMNLQSFEDLLKRDEQRVKDGFPKKIKVKRVMAGPGKIIVVPYIEEVKLIHGDFEPNFDEEGQDSKEGEEGQGEGGEGDQGLGEAVGSGKGEVGDVIGQVPLQGEGDGESEDPQAGDEPGEHGIEAEAYKIGQELSEKFQLPNLRDKGKKVPTDEYVYDLTDRHAGSGQLLDKKATFKRIIKTNISLGRLNADNVDTAELIVGPKDRIYRVLSKEQLWKSQAIAIFLRDYSGSTTGEPTKIIVTQHLMIYSWLLVQYDKLVIPRFFVHDTEAREVTVEDYFRLSTGGGTLIPAGYRAVTEMVEGESLARDFNIYLFQGTDGEDFDDGREAIPEIEKILSYVNRMGVTVLKSPYYGDDSVSRFEQYVKKGNFEDRRDVFRMHVMSSVDVKEEDNIEAIKKLIAQD